eukprot:485889-Hanusia_phi.AAC.1
MSTKLSRSLWRIPRTWEGGGKEALSMDQASEGIMERVRGSIQSLGTIEENGQRLQGTLPCSLQKETVGKTFMTCMSRLTATHLSLEVDGESNLYWHYCIRIRLQQVGGGRVRSG